MKDYEGYGALARVYDILNKGADYAGYADFAEKCFDSFLGIRPALVLEMKAPRLIQFNYMTIPLTPPAKKAER